jgi:hypothetical protein
MKLVEQRVADEEREARAAATDLALDEEEVGATGVRAAEAGCIASATSAWSSEESASTNAGSTGCAPKPRLRSTSAPTGQVAVDVEGR